MLVRFWGTRGSLPTPGPGTVRYGGNTSCIEVRSGQSVAIFDCGTGARGLGASLAAESTGLTAHLFLSHVHWDHIQGFPFFLPVFLPTADLEVYGAPGMEVGLEESLSGQMQYTYFPVRLDDLSSHMSFYEVGEDSFRAGEFDVATQYLNHTCPAVGYRLMVGGASVAYLSDHEPFWPHDTAGRPEDLLHHPANRRHARFAEGADLLIHDAQYLSEEYPARRGWGHSTIDYAVDVAISAGVRRLALFHHDPMRDDAAMDRLLARARERALALGSDLEVLAAAEGGEIEIEEPGSREGSLQPLIIGSRAAPARILLLGTEERRRQLREALSPDAYRLNEGDLSDGEQDWGALDPDLVVVATPAGEPIEDLLSSVAKVLGGTPLVAVLEEVVDQATLRRIGEVAADVIGVPFGGPNLRARVRACLARRQRSARVNLVSHASAGEEFAVTDVLPPAEVAAMIRAGTTCGFRPGEVLFEQGEVAAGVYFMRRGIVKVVVATPDGREVTVGYAGPGETIGEMSALDGSPRSATVVAMEPVEATYVSRDGFRETISQTPETAMRLLQLLVRRLRSVDQMMANVGATQGPAADQPQGSNGLDDRLLQLQKRIDQLGLTRDNLDWYAANTRSTGSRD